MDAVERASISQIRREELKRLQLKNSVLIEENKRIRELEKAEKERMRTHMTAAQALQRVQLEEQHRQLRQQRAAALMHNQDVLRLESGGSLSPRHLQVLNNSARMQEEKRLEALAKEQAYEYQLMNTEYLHKQAQQLAKVTAQNKELHRSVIYQKARENDHMKRSSVEEKIRQEDERFMMTQVHKEHILRMQKENFQIKAAESRRKVKNREAEVMAYRQVQSDKYDSKRERAEWIEAEKERLKADMQQRRLNLSMDEEMYQQALRQVQDDRWDPHNWAPSSMLAGAPSAKFAPPPSAYHPHLRLQNQPYSEAAGGGGRGGEGGGGGGHQPRQPPSRPQSASQAARDSMQQTYLETAGAQRPRSASRKRSTDAGMTMSARDVEIQNKLNEESRREKEREAILRQVQDPRQRNRLHKLFSIERHQAQQAIIRLQTEA